MKITIDLDGVAKVEEGGASVPRSVNSINSSPRTSSNAKEVEQGGVLPEYASILEYNAHLLSSVRAEWKSFLSAVMGVE